MKTHKHGQGLTHKQVVRFSNRLAASAQHNDETYANEYQENWVKGWEAACKHFAHELRKELRYRESESR